MKCTNKIYHKPFYPIPRMGDEGKPYICRLIPSEDGFSGDYLYEKELSCTLYYSVNDEEWKSTSLNDKHFSVSGIPADTELKVYIKSENGEMSRVRKVRTGILPPGATIINYLHPEDDNYIPSGQFLASPCLARLKSGAIIASMDTHMWYGTENLVPIYKSTDNGKTFKYVTDLTQFFWSTLFVHKDVLYILGVTTLFGNLHISASYDEGETWTVPVTLMYGGRAYSYGAGIHKGPMQVVNHKGRLYTTIEYASFMESRNFGVMADFSPAVISIDENDDLLCPENWKCTGFSNYEGKWKEECEKNAVESQVIAGTGAVTETKVKRGDAIEGNVVVGPDGKIYSYLRWKVGEAVVFSIDENDPEAPLTFEKIIKMPVTDSLFRILRYNDKYYLITNRKTEVSEKLYNGGFRNVLSIFSSTDLENWDFVYDIVNRESDDVKTTGFQYPAVLPEEDGFLVAVRSAFNKPNNFHDSNHILLWKVDKELLGN